MAATRLIDKVFTAQEVMEGAGVRLKRGIGYPQLPLFDPFLMLDDIHSQDPGDYVAGFPWHPHRGIETVTYLLSGEVEHGDSMGNKGVISSGEVQWMTAGSGIIHQEMPKPQTGVMRGLQLWVNLPASEKMTTPRYQDLRAGDVPLVEGPKGEKVRVVSGSYETVRGPVEDLFVSPQYLDVSIGPDAPFQQEVTDDHTAFIYILEGEAGFEKDVSQRIGTGQVVLFERRGRIVVRAGNRGARFLLMTGKPLGEPIAWRGPIVMNSQEELNRAFSELDSGEFVKN